jgi:hypothetical protein
LLAEELGEEEQPAAAMAPIASTAAVKRILLRGVIDLIMAARLRHYCDRLSKVRCLKSEPIVKFWQ